MVETLHMYHKHPRPVLPRADCVLSFDSCLLSLKKKKKDWQRTLTSPSPCIEAQWGKDTGRKSGMRWIGSLREKPRCACYMQLKQEAELLHRAGQEGKWGTAGYTDRLADCEGIYGTAIIRP